MAPFCKENKGKQILISDTILVLVKMWQPKIDELVVKSISCSCSYRFDSSNTWWLTVIYISRLSGCKTSSGLPGHTCDADLHSEKI